MAEVLGVVSGVASLADQLLKASLKGYDIFSQAQAVGADYGDFRWKVEHERHRLLTWAKYWITDKPRLEEGNEVHQHAVATLARIAAVFNDVKAFKARYGIELSPTDGSSPPSLAPREKNRSHRISWNKLRGRSPTPAPEPVIDDNSIEQLHNALPQVLEQKVSDMKKAALDLQTRLSAWDKICWAVTEKNKALGLAQRLEKYNKALYDLLSPPFQENRVVTGPSAAALAATIGFDVSLSLPYPRNGNFYGRQDVLKEINEALQTNTAPARGVQKIVVLDGLGGIGKSQIALEYAYHHWDMKTFTSIFWVDATDTNTLRKSAEDIAGQLVMHYKTSMTTQSETAEAVEKLSVISQVMHLEGQIDMTTGRLISSGRDSGQILDAVKRWFTRPGNDRFLIIIDNWDDIDAVDAKVLLPNCGSVIITSRRVLPDSVCITVDPIDHDSGLALLKASAGKRKSNLTDLEFEAATKLAERLGYLPLALDQAGAYVAKTTTFAKYHRLLDENINILESKRRALSLHAHTRSDTVFTTWEISFRQLSGPAQELLLLCSFISNQDIPDKLFEEACGQESTQKFMPWMNGNNGLQEAFADVFSFSLATRMDSDELENFSIHPLVHDWARARLDDATKRRKAAEAVVLLGCIGQLAPHEKSTQDWIFQRRIYPHLSLCCQNFKLYNPQENVMRDLHFFEATSNVANVLNDQGKSDEALGWYQQTLAGREKTLGEEHPKTLSTVHNIAFVFANQGKYDEALKLYQRALVGREKALGKDHPSTLFTVHNMAGVFDNQGEYDEALEWYQRALAGEEKALGKEHPETLSTVHNMGLVFANQGKYDEALEWYQRALAGEEKALGKEHSSTLTTVHNMAWVFNNQGKYDEALEWYQRALAGEEKALGKEHPDTLTMVHNMALVFNNQGKYDEALELYQRALAGREKALGKEHPHTQSTVRCLIDVCKKVGQLDNAAELGQRLC